MKRPIPSKSAIGEKANRHLVENPTTYRFAAAILRSFVRWCDAKLILQPTAKHLTLFIVDRDRARLAIGKAAMPRKELRAIEAVISKVFPRTKRIAK